MKSPKIPEKLRLLPAKQIIALHRSDIPDHFDAIKDSMKKNGWKGRPLLVVKTGSSKYRALTGSHRLAAAKRLRMKEVPCMVITPKNPKDVFEEFDSKNSYMAYTKIGRRLTKMGFYLAGMLMSKDYNTPVLSKKGT